MACCNCTPCSCGGPTTSNSGGSSGGSGGSGGGGSGGRTNPDGTICTDPGILQWGTPLILNEDFCTKRTRLWRGRDSEGDPITDINVAPVNAYFAQGEAGFGATDQPCVKFPELKVWTYGTFADFVMGRKDGCEFDLSGQTNVPGLLYWDGANMRFVAVEDLNIPVPSTCGTLGAGIILAQYTTSYTATISDGLEFMAKDLTVNVGGYEMIITAILDADTGSISLDLVATLTEPFVNIAAGSSVCPVGFKSNNVLYPAITPAEMQSGPKILLQLPNKALRRMSDPDPSLGAAILLYDFVTGGLKWANYIQPGISTVFAYKGYQETLTVPAWAVKMKVYAWGAGGASEGGALGGVGGFTWGYFDVTAGDVYGVIVGAGGSTLDYVTPFGFGGKASPSPSHNLGGGGLSGLFTGASAVSPTDSGRALIIAGGGGAGSTTTPGVNAITGGSGNGAGSGGMTTMSGNNATGTATTGTGGGGGGYRGGNPNGLAGFGGTGFLDAAKLDGQILFGNTSSPAVPGSDNPYYRTEVGTGGIILPGPYFGGNGLLAVEFF